MKLINHAFLENYKVSLIFGAVGGLFLVAAVIVSMRNSSGSRVLSEGIKIIENENKATSSGVLGGIIIVDIEGAVNSPGLYELPTDARVSDLLEKAGGLTNNADDEWVSKNINKAQKLHDGVKLYIPLKSDAGEANTEGSLGSQSTMSASGTININTASKTELETLSGVGEKTSQKIIDNRPYNSIEELVEKDVIWQSTYDKIKDKISVF